MRFVDAVKSQSRARVALNGPAGAGKTLGALMIAQGIIDEMGGGRIALIDTEHGSASKYADRYSFQTLEGMPDYSPENYSKAIRLAGEAGFDVLVIDSLSHAWSGRGGALELKDQAAARSRSGNSWTAWREVTPLHNQLIEDILASPCHVVGTMRSKMEYVQEKDDDGKTKIRKLGMSPVQRDGMEYEFDIVGDVDLQHKTLITKSRWSVLDGFYDKIDEDFGRKVAAWLSEGDPPIKVFRRKVEDAGATKTQVIALMDRLGAGDKSDSWTAADYIRANEALDRYGDSLFTKAEGGDKESTEESTQPVAGAIAT